MVNLTFGEQVKIMLGRKGMTIKKLAEQIEARTGKPMSRQNLTQRLGRDNFQEKDMRLIAEILECQFQLSIMDLEEKVVPKQSITIGDLLDLSVAAEESHSNEASVKEEIVEKQQEEPFKEIEEESEERKLLRKGVKAYYRKTSEKPKTENVKEETGKAELPKEEVLGEVNPYTGKEYKTNSVRMHPKRIGYVQVYDQKNHRWADMTEWAFLGYQERKKLLLGKDYEPPIYLD